MEERIWRVKTTYGYRDVVFDFDSAEEASEFVKTCCLHFNKEKSEDEKDLFLSMSYVLKSSDGDTDD